jgi:UDP-N-acetylmuramate: L-alanyl-gamma-D-glutamyl-meso-diaminopimelate ligase
MKIHFLSIGGAVMHNLAIALKRAGHQITGSDDEIYDPARTKLKEEGILPDSEGWNESNIHSDLDLVILGMHARADNPELKKALELGLKIQSFPEFIFDHSRSKKRVVVGGSHGKTTTTSIIMHALQHVGRDFDYLVGARLEGFDTMVKLSDAPLIVIEGDEYLSSAIDRRPKFLHYKAQLSVLTGIAWDHMNVFPTEENYFSQFVDYLNSLPPDSKVLYFEEDSLLQRLIKNHKPEGVYAVPYNRVNYKKGSEEWKVVSGDGETYPVGLFGSHNMANLEAARRICLDLGLSESEFFNAMASFKGAQKRLQLIADVEGRTFYHDFAHAPSKVRATVNSFRERFPDDSLCTVVELHTYSSLNQKFLPHYRGALDKADHAIVFFSPHTLKMKRMPPLDEDIIKEHFGRSDIKVVNDADELREKLVAANQSNPHFLLMSSGTFGGSDLKKLAGELLG